MDPAVFQPLGVAGIVCSVLVWVIVDQRATIRELRQELKDANKAMVDDIVPLATRMLDALKEAGEIVRTWAVDRRGGGT